MYRVPLTSGVMLIFVIRNMIVSCLGLSFRCTGAAFNLTFGKRMRKFNELMARIAKWFYKYTVTIHSCPRYFFATKPDGSSEINANINCWTTKELMQKGFHVLLNDFQYYIISEELL